MLFAEKLFGGFFYGCEAGQVEFKKERVFASGFFERDDSSFHFVLAPRGDIHLRITLQERLSLKVSNIRNEGKFESRTWTVA